MGLHLEVVTLPKCHQDGRGTTCHMDLADFVTCSEHDPPAQTLRKPWAAILASDMTPIIIRRGHKPPT